MLVMQHRHISRKSGEVAEIKVTISARTVTLLVLGAGVCVWQGGGGLSGC